MYSNSTSSESLEMEYDLYSDELDEIITRIFECMQFFRSHVHVIVICDVAPLQGQCVLSREIHASPPSRILHSHPQVPISPFDLFRGNRLQIGQKRTSSVFVSSLLLHVGAFPRESSSHFPPHEDPLGSRGRASRTVVFRFVLFHAKRPSFPASFPRSRQFPRFPRDSRLRRSCRAFCRHRRERHGGERIYQLFLHSVRFGDDNRGSVFESIYECDRVATVWKREK